MTTIWDKLNLRPQERRWVVMAAAALFVVLQFWLVWPHFSEWRQTKAAGEKAKKTLVAYQAALAQTNEYRIKLQKLEGQQGTGLLNPEKAGNLLITRILAQARESKVNYSGINVLPSGSKSDEFFVEQTLNFGVNPTGAQELVDFLFAIGNSDLMVRVKELNLNPDQGGYKLQGSMRLVASFQKKSSIGPATVKPATALSSSKP